LRVSILFTHARIKGASYRAHFELAMFLWQELASAGDSPPPVEVKTEIVLSLERCLQLHPTHPDALKALSLFHMDVRRDIGAAVQVLEELAKVPLPPTAAPHSCRLSPPLPTRSCGCHASHMHHPDCRTQCMGASAIEVAALIATPGTSRAAWVSSL